MNTPRKAKGASRRLLSLLLILALAFTCVCPALAEGEAASVSYTHLDVYKRQDFYRVNAVRRRTDM